MEFFVNHTPPKNMLPIPEHTSLIDSSVINKQLISVMLSNYDNIHTCVAMAIAKRYTESSYSFLRFANTGIIDDNLMYSINNEIAFIIEYPAGKRAGTPEYETDLNNHITLLALREYVKASSANPPNICKVVNHG